MGLLPIHTDFEKEKVRMRVEGQTLEMTGEMSILSGKRICGYEIHMGRTRHSGKALFETTCENGIRQDGCVQGNVFGTYIHGVFDADDFRQAFVNMLLRRKGLEEKKIRETSFAAYRQSQYDQLANVLRQSIDMERVYEIMGLPGARQSDEG